MKYLCLIYNDEEKLAALSGPEYDDVVNAVLDFREILRERGNYIASAPLQPAETATTVRVRGGRVSITDGPFAETKEHVGGFYFIEARDLNDAIRLVAKMPPARLGSVEVRPIQEFSRRVSDEEPPRHSFAHDGPAAHRPPAPTAAEPQRSRSVRRIIATEYLTLDGVMDEPGTWSFPFWNEEAGQFKFDELFACDALLLGRLTYEGFAAAWPTMADDVGFADRMNGMPKYVVSTTMEHAGWTNSTVIRGNVAEELARLKAEPGQDILLAGSGQLVRALMAAGLIDEYRFMVHPIVLGGGKRLFDDGAPPATLRLTGTKVFSTGIVVHTYEPAGKGAGATEPARAG